MNLCPLCNAFSNIQQTCDTCHSSLKDKGRLMDYFDDYSAYLEIDDMKKIDGIQTDLQQHQCPHVLFCDSCGKSTINLVSEWHAVY